MPWANDQSAWARWESPVASRNGSPGPVLEPGRERCPVEGAAGAQAVQVGVFEAERPVGGQDARHRRPPAGMSDGVVEHDADLGQGFFDDGCLDGGLVGEVLVDRRCPDAEFVAEPAHRQRMGTFRLEHRSGGGDNLERSCRPRGAGGGRTSFAIGRQGQHAQHAQRATSSRNTGCLGAMARIASSVELASTPSKNTPTSAFHRFR